MGIFDFNKKLSRTDESDLNENSFVQEKNQLGFKSTSFTLFDLSSPNWNNSPNSDDDESSYSEARAIMAKGNFGDNYERAIDIILNGLKKCNRKDRLCELMANIYINRGDTLFIGWYMQSCLIASESWPAYLVVSYVAKAVGLNNLALRCLFACDVLDTGMPRLDDMKRHVEAIIKKNKTDYIKKSLHNFEKNMNAYLPLINALPEDHDKREIIIMQNLTGDINKPPLNLRLRLTNRELHKIESKENSTVENKNEEIVIEVNTPTAISKEKDRAKLTDTDGNVYTTIKIGNQMWTVENLRATKCNDGSPIPLVSETSEWIERFSPAYCWYENDINNKAKYGALYNWHVVNTGTLAPIGWHIPTDAEWTELEEYLIANGYNWDGTTTDNKIGQSLAAKTDWSYSKEEGKVGNEFEADNRAGFLALPGGYRGHSGIFNFKRDFGYWWSSTECDTSSAFNRYLFYAHALLYREIGSKSCGFSVRLVRDSE